jgi:hypothetical protein
MEPITTALIVGLAAQKFAEGAAGKAAEKLVENLWDAIASKFKDKGRPKVEETIAKVSSTQDKDAMEKLGKILDAEFIEDEKFEAYLKDLAQKIINIDKSQNQAQEQFNMEVNARDNARVSAVSKLNATTVSFGDQH